MNINDELFTEIQEVNLNDSSIGSNINDNFKAIQENFKAIFQKEYLKGIQGDSIKTQEITLSDNEKLLNTFVNLICEEIPVDTIKRDKKIQVIDQLKSNQQKLIVICKESENNTEELYLASLPFTYKDDTEDNIDLEKTNKYLDLSCIIYYDYDEQDVEKKWKKINLFPTLYFDTEKQLYCWKVNGIETKLSAQGTPGTVGPQGPGWHLAKTEEEGFTGNSATIQSIFVIQTKQNDDNTTTYSGEWINIYNEDETINEVAYKELQDGSRMIVYDQGLKEIDKKGWYLAYLKIVQNGDKKEYKAYTCSDNFLSLSNLFGSTSGLALKSEVIDEAEIRELILDAWCPKPEEGYNRETIFKEGSKSYIDVEIKTLDAKIAKTVNKDAIDKTIQDLFQKRFNDTMALIASYPHFWDTNMVLGSDAVPLYNNYCYRSKDDTGRAAYEITLPSIAQATQGVGSSTQTHSFLFKIVIPRYYEKDGKPHYTSFKNLTLNTSTKNLPIYSTSQADQSSTKIPLNETQVEEDKINKINPNDKVELIFTGYKYTEGTLSIDEWYIDSLILAGGIESNYRP